MASHRNAPPQPAAAFVIAKPVKRFLPRARARLLWLVLLIAPGLASAAELLGHRLDGDTLQLDTSDGPVELRFHGPAALEVHYQPPGRKQLPSFSLAGGLPPVAATLAEHDDALSWDSGELRVRIQRRPLQLSYARGDTPLLSEEAGLFHHETMRGFRFQLQPDEKLLGGGQRVLGMDRRGQRLPLYNRAHYGYTTKSKQMYFSLPGVISSRGYLLLFDNSARGHMDLGHSESDVLQFEAVAGRTSYLVVAGEALPQIVGNYVQATGLPPLAPRWTLGHYASRFGYRTEAEARDVVRRYREQGIPLDAIVLDLYWFGPDIQGHMGNLDWDRQAWPTPEQMISDFAADGVRTILITEPFILKSSTRWDEAVAANALGLDLAGRPKRFDFYFGNTGIIDVFRPEARRWFQNLYADLDRQGVAGWWGDLGEPEVHPKDTIHAIGSADELHNAYGHEWARLVWEGQRELHPERRPFIMMRAGAPGSQRYGMVPWTGDVDRSWGGLQSQVELALQMGLFGFGWIHSDLGGFAGGKRFDRELYLRWMLYGVFQPVHRPHAQEHIAPEPVFHDRDTRRLARDFIRLRYALLPYHYTLAWEHATTGQPLMRPLAFLDPNDPSLLDRHDAYLWGDALLVAPVVKPGVRTSRVDLPRGVWFDYWTGKRHVGPARVQVATPLHRIPVFARAGAFLPMIEAIERSDDYSTRELIVHHWPDASVSESRGRLYDDDGSRFASHQSGAHEIVDFHSRHQGDSLTLSLNRRGGDYAGRPEQRRITLVLHQWAEAPASIRIDGQAASQPPELQIDHDRRSRRLTLNFDWRGDATTLQLVSGTP